MSFENQEQEKARLLKFSDLYLVSGEIDRGAYVVWGLILFFIKFNINKYLQALFEIKVSWSVPYMVPGSGVFASAVPENFSPEKVYGALPLLITSLPFIWCGVILTLRRLRSIKAPQWLAVLFFVPFVNFILFAVLSLIPGVEESKNVATDPEEKLSTLKRIVPENPKGAALMAVGITSLIGLGLTYIATDLVSTYGGGLFVGVPFVIGFLSVLIWSVHERMSYKSCIGISWVCTTVLGTLLLGLGIEGILCIVMAIPIAMILALMGATVAYFIQKEAWRRVTPDSNQALLVLALPLLLIFTIGYERERPKESFPLYAVTTSIDVSASPEVVWKNVVTFPDLDPPSALVFLAGVAYPVGATIKGEGVGAIRHCRFSTGPFVEPIEVWDPPRLLKFSVTSTPPPMEEWSPYRHIHPPHMNNFFRSEGGQFLLIPLPNNRTRIEGTTWYRHEIAPSWYWKIYSDYIIHLIHGRVLEHVKRLAETEI